MAKHKLVWEDDYDFDLIGICSSNSDYRLCWGVNNALDLKLERAEDYALRSKKEGEYLSYWENGKLYQKGNYIDNKVEGDVLWYNENGQYEQTTNWGRSFE